jgi:hypothetical protein
VEPALLSASGTAVIPKEEWIPTRAGQCCSYPVGISNKTHIADCVTEENGDFSFELPTSPDKSSISQYILNFEISAPGYTLPEGSPIVVTDMVNASDGPRYTFNVCLQQPSEPNVWPSPKEHRSHRENKIMTYSLNDVSVWIIIFGAVAGFSCAFCDCVTGGRTERDPIQ